MSFWLTAAILTFLACAALLWSFRKGSEAETADGYDIEVYRDQLAELDSEAARGAVGRAEAEEARAEIGRRILKAVGAAGQGGAARAGRAGRLVAATAVLSVPLVTWGGYALTGSPGVPDQRLAERLNRNPAQNTVEELIARAERHLAENPSDGRGWEVLAPIYMRTGRAADAVAAWRHAIGLGGATAQREAGLGEALTAAASGVVTAEAEQAFARALSLDPVEPRARFFSAMAMLQEGRAEDAKAAWRAMAAELPADSPWAGAVARAVASIDESPAVAAGPSADDVAAAQAMAPQDRQAMIEGMVAGLDARLREDPADGEGWRRLVSSYMVLGRSEAAHDALARGLAALGETTEAGRALAALGAELGMDGSRTR